MLLLAGVSLMAACSADDMPAPGGESSVPEAVTVYMTVNRPGGQATRTVLTEESNGTLTSTWTEGDKLLVVTADGTKAGELTLQDGAKTAKGVFSGELNIADNSTARVWYLGASNGEAAPYTATVETGGKITSLKTNLGSALGMSFGDLKRAELLTNEVTFTVSNGKGYVKPTEGTDNGVLLTAQMAMSHFTLTMPEGVQTAEGATLTVTSAEGDQLPNVKVWNAADPATAVSADEETGTGYSLTLPSGQNKVDLYLPLVPGEYKLKFDVASGGKTYTYTLTEKSKVEAGIYYTSGSSSDGTSGNYAGISIPVKEEDDEVVGPEFTIKNRDGKEVKVRFTRANLHYRTADVENPWYLPLRQTDFVGKPGLAAGYDGKYTSQPVIDLFRWGATGYSDFNITVVNPVMQYVSSSQSSGSYWPYKPAKNQYLSTINNNVDMRTNDDKYTDWGWMYGFMLNGGKSYEFPDLYYTLSGSEWKDLVGTYVHTCATVNGVEGVLMLPQTNEEDAKNALKAAGIDIRFFYRLHNSYFDTHKTSYTWSMITIDDYDKLKALNAVFLPKAGSHYPGNPNPSYNELNYWESKCTSSNGSNFWVRLYDYSTSADLKQSNSSGKQMAFSVRLVKVVEGPDDSEVVNGN